MTLEEYHAIYAPRLVDMALRGIILDGDYRPAAMGTGGTTSAGQLALTLPARVKTLLDRMYQDAQPPPVPEKPDVKTPTPATANGRSANVERNPPAHPQGKRPGA